MVASRPLLGRATTLAKNLVRYSVASSSVPPASMTWPYAASAFQRAAPDDAGFGVTISTPGWIRSSQVWMFFGVALADGEHDDRGRHDALVRAVVPGLGDEARVDQPGDVAGHREVDVVGLEAVDDRPALVAGGAVGGLELDALALRGLRPLLGDGLVGGLGHGEADDVDLAVVLAPAAEPTPRSAPPYAPGAAVVSRCRGRSGAASRSRSSGCVAVGAAVVSGACTVVCALASESSSSPQAATATSDRAAIASSRFLVFMVFLSVGGGHVKRPVWTTPHDTESRLIKSTLPT